MEAGSETTPALEKSLGERPLKFLLSLLPLPQIICQESSEDASVGRAMAARITPVRFLFSLV